MEEKEEIQWFEKLRLNSWEVEILIVGFVLVMLFNIPDTLSLEQDKMGEGFVGRVLQDALIFTVVVVWFQRGLVRSILISVLKN